MPWLLSWLGEGFHFRALTHAQRSEGSKVSGRYNTFMGEVVERYALDLAHSAIDDRARVLGEQPYGKGGGKRTPDVAVVWGRDLILFEVHARRVKADVLATGEEAEALEEVSKLLVVKIDQVAARIEDLFGSEATLPDVKFYSIERIWPIVVSVGHLIQTRHVWDHLRASVTAETTGTLARARVQPLQFLDMTDYERLLGIIEAGASLPAMLARKTEGPFAERDLAAWLSGDRSAPPADARLSLLEERWKVMGTKLERTAELAQSGREAPP